MCAFATPTPSSLRAVSRQLPPCPRRPLTARAEAPPSVTDMVDPSPRAVRVRLAPRNHWTNPDRRLLIQRAEGLYTIDRTYNFARYIDVGSRCIVVVMPPSSGARPKLLLFSPVPLYCEPALRDELRALGDVAVILAPNNEHVDFVASAAKAFPDAAVLGPPGCRQRWPHLPFDADTFEDDGRPHAALRAFSEVLTPHFVPSVAYFNETVLIHRPSRTLVVCDLWWNWPTFDEARRRGVRLSWQTRTFALGMDRLFLPFYSRVMVKDRKAFGGFYKALRAERFQGIIPCHGYPVEEDGMRIFDDFFPSFLRTA